VTRTSDRYLVVVRAISAAHLPFDEPLKARLQGDECAVMTEHVGGKDGWPISLRGEVRASAENIEDAQERLPERVLGLFPLVALAANAAHAEPGLVVVHGLSPRPSEPVDWIAYEWEPPSNHFPPYARTVSPALVGALLEAADKYPSKGYHGRAVGLYGEALKYWTPESRLLAGEYLWMATEALSRGLVEAEAAKENMTPKNLAQQRKSSVTALYKQAREQVIFPNDHEALDALEKASDGFEHGYMTIPDVRALIEPVLERAARHVRRALISSTGMPKDGEKELLAADYDEPRAMGPLIQVLRGRLEVRDPSAAPDEIEDAVEVSWEPQGARHVERDEKGKLAVTGTVTATAQGLPPGVRLSVDRRGVRGQGIRGIQVGEPIVRRAGE
jgi:hypothetical protein